jgi:MinD superfamily P-loop ATPase/flavin reductase (DIM6/NTAB) family NADH-FMN oxidoreductase RutF
MKQLLILSGKGGTGKTTIASAFIQLAQAKTYADCDVDAPNLALITKDLPVPIRTDFFGMDNAEIDTNICIKCGLCQKNCRFDAISFKNDLYQVDPFACEGCGVCEEFCPVGAATLKPSKAGDLLLYKNDAVFSTAQLKMGSGNSGLLVSEVKKRMVLESKDSELSIIDGSPGIGCPVIASLSGVDMVLIVVEPSISGISDMERIIKTAEKFQTEIVICINKFDTNLKNTNIIEEYCRINKLACVGKVPYDTQVIKAINKGRTVLDGVCKAGLAITAVFNETMKVLKIEKISNQIKNRGIIMEKGSAKMKSALQPVPKVLVSCRGLNGEENALVVGYCGNCSYNPPMVMIGIVPSRYSYKLIKESGCFVVNLVDKNYQETYNYLGSHSKRNEDKLKKMNVALNDGKIVNAPILSDCPVNIECTIVDSIVTGSHEMFIGKIEYVHADQKLLDKDGNVDYSQIDFV